MATWFTSDTHFGDHRVLNIRGGRPFASVKEMDAAMLARWNATVQPDDVVWHLGDFARNAPLAAELLPRLNGTKHLVVGNNDPTPPQGWVAQGWASAAPYVETEVEGVRLVLCHYPFRTWNGAGKGVLNLHGHSHGRLEPLCHQHDVGVDVWDFTPVSLAALTARRPRARGSQAG